MQKILKYSVPLLFLLSVIGIADATYLTIEHYNEGILPCSINTWIDCGKVIKGEYSEVFGIPLSFFGLLFYSSFFVTMLINKFRQNILLKYYLIISSFFAFLFSIYLVSLMLFIIKAICPYCLLSAATSTLLFLISLNYFDKERKKLTVLVTGFMYQNILKKIFFLVDPEIVHEHMLDAGERFGKSTLAKKVMEFLFVKPDKAIEQNAAGLRFKFPVGMAAGFDYEAKLTQYLPSLGFGFATVGTITNLPYEGNPKPRLGRLPKSKSLLVNKGFKNEGADAVAKKLSKLKFGYNQGVSIGRSNSEKLSTQKDSVNDIIRSFKTFEKYKVRNAYYELNISCPNLIHGDVDFYKPKNLDGLLGAVDKLKLKKPIFIKMPIEKTDREVLAMLKIIDVHKIAGVIFGNLQKDRKHKSLQKDEVKKFKMGYFSGKPTWERSNELIKLSYKRYGMKLVIIGCGGIFSAHDAYTKIKLGASLVQLITGLIYQGPQLVSEINLGLGDLLKKDGYKHLSEAVGMDVQ